MNLTAGASASLYLSVLQPIVAPETTMVATIATRKIESAAFESCIPAPPIDEAL